MEIQSATATASLTSASVTEATAKKPVSSDFETFLRMLTVQMKNQDPLNPIDSADYAVQLATFSGVEQQVKTNDLLANLGQQMGMSQLAGWVGMDARTSGPAWFDGSPLSIAPKRAAGADQAYLIVRDTTGAEVQRQELTTNGSTTSWAGVDADGDPLVAGLYTFAVESRSQGTVMSVDPVPVYSRVAEARNENGAVVLVLEGGVEVSANDVSALREHQN